MADENKSEQATQRRRQKAREEGQVLRSRELGSSLSLLTGVLLLATLAPRWGVAWRALLQRDLDVGATHDLAHEAVLSTQLLPMSVVMPLAGVGLLLGALWMAALAATLAQGGIVVAPALLQPKIQRISPAAKLKQLFSLAGLSSLLKTLLPTAVVTWLVWQMVLRDWHPLLTSSRMGFRVFLSFLASRLYEAGWKVGLVMLGWAGVDYLLQRQHFESGLKMSRQEVREEAKDSEGNPMVKGRIRRLQRQMRRRRMMQEVKQATVVITNPHEYAIAIQYSPEMPAPVVVAKGRNRLAQQIKQIALWQGIPMIENKPLAHTLYRAVEIGQSIPPKLYAVVAEVLAAIFRAQARAAGGR